MNNALALKKNHDAIESALVGNDISKLSPEERISYINALCESVGLNPLTKPFAFLKLQGREVVYATKDCSEQLRKIHGVSTQIVSQGVVGDAYELHVKAQDKTGRQDEDFASIPVNGIKGADLSNLKMKCVTKAKRRVTLSICGLGILDESELDTIAQELKKKTSNPQITNPLKEATEAKKPDDVQDVFENEPGSSEIIEDVDQADLGNYVIQVGKKLRGQKLSETDIFELESYVNWVEDGAKKTGKGYGDFAEFMEVAKAYLKSRESNPK